MADIPVVEVEAVDAVLDGLTTPTSSEVYSAVDPFSNAAVASAAASRAIAGGSGGSTPNLAAVLTEGNDGGTAGLVNTGEITTGGSSLYTEDGSIEVGTGSVIFAGGGANGGTIVAEGSHLKFTGNAPAEFSSGIDAGEYPIVNIDGISGVHVTGGTVTAAQLAAILANAFGLIVD
jgi:hypothetical protein